MNKNYILFVKRKNNNWYGFKTYKSEKQAMDAINSIASGDVQALPLDCDKRSFKILVPGEYISFYNVPTAQTE